MKKTILENTKAYRKHIGDMNGVYPRTLNLEITSYCNLRCMMCPKTVGFHTHKPDSKHSEKTFRKIIKEIIPHIHHLNLMGFGEPLIVKEQLLELLEACKREHVTVNLITNGLLLDRELAFRIVELGLYNMNVSLDAATPQTYKKIRGNDFELVKRNLKYVLEAKKELNSEYPTLDLSFVGMVDNIKELPDFINLACELGARKVVLQALSEVPDSLVHNQDVFIHNRELGLKYYHKALEVAEKTGMTLELFPPDQFETEREDSEDDHKIPEIDGEKMIKSCTEPWHAMFLSAEGTVSPCCGLGGYGDLNETSFDDIWNGKKMSGLRSVLKTEKIPQSCIYCRGEGWHKPTVLCNYAIPSVNDSQFGLDWHSPEYQSDEPVRWSTETGTYFTTNGDSAALELESGRNDINLAIKINDNVKRTIDFSGENKRKIIFIDERDLVYKRTGEDVARIILEPSQTFIPAVSGSNDGRKLGILFYGHRPLRKIKYSTGELLIAFREQNSRLTVKDGYIRLAGIMRTEEKRQLRIAYILQDKNETGAPGSLFLPSLYLNKRRSSHLQTSESLATGDELQELVYEWKTLKKGKYDLYIALWSLTGGKILKPLNDKIDKQVLIGSFEIG